MSETTQNWQSDLNKVLLHTIAHIGGKNKRHKHLRDMVNNINTAERTITVMWMSRD